MYSHNISSCIALEQWFFTFPTLGAPIPKDIRGLGDLQSVVTLLVKVVVFVHLKVKESTSAFL